MELAVALLNLIPLVVQEATLYLREPPKNEAERAARAEKMQAFLTAVGELVRKD